MSESQFDANVRLWLHRRYFPWGIFENNKTGYGEAYHAPFGGRGGADIVGHLWVLHVEIENKSKRGKLRTEQKMRQARLNKPWSGIYLVCRETCSIFNGVDEGFIAMCGQLESHFIQWLGNDRLEQMRLKPW